MEPSSPDCPSCRDLAAKIAEIVRVCEGQQREIEELKARLGRNSGNSSKPPSSDGPWSKRRKRRRPSSGKKQGGQPGHPGKTRELVDEDEVDDVVDHEPKECSQCGCRDLLADGPAPRRHQVVEIPPLVATITEHRLHRRICASCGEEIVAALPPDVPRSAFGPRLQALTATLVAGYRLSRSETSRLLSEAFGVSMSVGSVSAIEHRMSRALEPAFEEALQALRTSALTHVDETPWKKRGILHWLWTGVGEGVTVHRIDRRRNREALTRLLGTDYDGIRVTDRLASYDKIPAKQRQLCWAHLERDFRGFAQGPRKGRAFGKVGVDIAQALMRCVRHHRQHGDRARFEEEVRPHLGDLIELLVDGACSEIPKVSGFAAHLLARSDSLWTFVDHEGVPPTNNAAERSIRKAVLWRKNCFGSQSDRGLRFAERMLTVIATKRRRAEAVLDYLVEVARTAICGSPAPPLMPQTAPS
jgi:transposase